MKIAFNGQRFAGQRFGVGRYLEYLLRHWATMLRDDESVSVFVRRPLEADMARLHPRIVPELLESAMSGIPWENLRLRSPARRHDVLFCPAYTAPIGYRGRLVVATHSVNESQPGMHSWAYRQGYARLHHHCARLADMVIVPAESTRDEVMRHYGIPGNRIAIVAQGADDAFRPTTDESLKRSVRERYFGHDRPYILFVGKCSERRNIPMLLRAFARLRHEDGVPHGLLLFGPNHENLPLVDLTRELDIEDDVVQTDGRIAHHADLVPIYGAADLFVHPSEHEGWSITTVEALACGTAVVATNRGGLGEVARGHALMVDEPSVEAFHHAMRQVLNDETLRIDLQRLARQRGQALRWDTLARQTLDVIRDVATGTRHPEVLSA
ncbi:MAG: glycosyltransferase family 1 protein [Gemmatimonadales bacterium]